MVAPKDVSGVMVTLHIEDEQKLFVMLAADGMIKRMGTGTVECKENELFIGKAGTKAFERVRSQSGAILNNWLGSYASPEQLGKKCKLVVGFRTANSQEFISEWEYGTESQGPPPDVSSLVLASVEATSEWYGEKMKLAASTETPRPAT
jgi:hypothetical protein